MYLSNNLHSCIISSSNLQGKVWVLSLTLYLSHLLPMSFRLCVSSDICISLDCLWVFVFLVKSLCVFLVFIYWSTLYWVNFYSLVTHPHSLSCLGPLSQGFRVLIHCPCFWTNPLLIMFVALWGFFCPFWWNMMQSENVSIQESCSERRE